MKDQRKSFWQRMLGPMVVIFILGTIFLFATGRIKIYITDQIGGEFWGYIGRVGTTLESKEKLDKVIEKLENYGDLKGKEIKLTKLVFENNDAHIIVQDPDIPEYVDSYFYHGSALLNPRWRKGSPATFPYNEEDFFSLSEVSTEEVADFYQDILSYINENNKKIRRNHEIRIDVKPARLQARVDLERSTMEFEYDRVHKRFFAVDSMDAFDSDKRDPRKYGGFLDDANAFNNAIEKLKQREEIQGRSSVRMVTSYTTNETIHLEIEDFENSNLSQSYLYGYNQDWDWEISSSGTRIHEDPDDRFDLNDISGEGIASFYDQANQFMKAHRITNEEPFRDSVYYRGKSGLSLSITHRGQSIRFRSDLDGKNFNVEGFGD